MTSSPWRLRACLFLGFLAASLAVLPATAAAQANGSALPIRSPAGGDSGFGSFLAGLAAERGGDYGAAADFLMEALARDPNQPELLLQTFTLSAAEGRMNRALTLAQRLRDIGIEETGALLLLAGDALAKGEAAQARALLAAQPEGGLAVLTRPLLDAWLAAAEGEGEEALERLALLELEPGLGALVELHRLLLLDVLGRPAEALAAAEALLQRGERPSLRIVWHVGNLLEREGQAERAEALYDEFEEANPDSLMLEAVRARRTAGIVPAPLVPDARSGFAQALFDFASLMAQEQATIPALVHARLALHLVPDLLTARVLVGEILQYQQRHAAAIELYEAIPADSPFAWNAGLRIAEELERLERHEEAAERLRRLAEQRPERHEPPYRLGNLLRGQERFAEAAEAYGEAIERIGQTTRQHWVLYYFRGIAHERSDRWEEAEPDFLRALELEPDQPYVLNYLAYSWVEQERNLEEAEEMLLRAVAREPDDGHIVDSLGWAYYRLGRYEEAVEQLERAVELRPQDSVINDHLGDAYWRSGREREAIVQWRRALSLDPEEEEVPVIERKLREGLPPPGERI